VTSTGQFVIAWDFAKVKKGFLDKYEIKKYEDHVVQDNFKFGDDKEIVSLITSYVVVVAPHPSISWLGIHLETEPLMSELTDWLTDLFSLIDCGFG
jgi:hypothetical protein